MFNRSSQHDDRDNGREPRTTARQAAEALFAPKPQRVEPPVRETAPAGEPPAGESPAGETVRKPRVLTVAAASPVPDKAETSPVPDKTLEASTRPEPKSEPKKTPAVSASQVASIRTWTKYGMTTQQVAQVLGLEVDEVARILRDG